MLGQSVEATMPLNMPNLQRIVLSTVWQPAPAWLGPSIPDQETATPKHLQNVQVLMKIGNGERSIVTYHMMVNF